MPPECTTSAAGRPEGLHAGTQEQLLFQLTQDELNSKTAFYLDALKVSHFLLTAQQFSLK